MTTMKALGLALLAATAATGASAATIDFDPVIAATTSYTEQGVTFTAEGGGTVTGDGYGITPNGTRGLLGRNAANTAFAPIRATFSSPVTDVSIDLGDYNSDDDSLFLRAFDAANTLLGTSTDFIPASFTGMRTLSISSGTNIAYVVYGAFGFNDESNIYTDNLVFTGAAVPEPATWAMMIGGIGLAGGALRRRRSPALRTA